MTTGIRWLVAALCMTGCSGLDAPPWSPSGSSAGEREGGPFLGGETAPTPWWIRPDVPEPTPFGEGWCSIQPTADEGLDEMPSTALELLQQGFALDPDAVRCPTDFDRWTPFVRRHTRGYTTTPRWGGFDDCVPQIDLEGRYGGVGITQTPLVTASYAVSRYGDLVLGTYADSGYTTDAVIAAECPDPVTNVLRQAEWLDEHAITRTHEGVETWSWGYDFVNEQGKLEAPWTSGYAQGVVAAAYLAAFCVSEDPHWLTGAEKALANLMVPMADGGTATWTSSDALWFEEAATPDARSARSLNGHLGALAGVWTVADWTGSSGAGRLLDWGANVALREIDAYDAGFISLYTQWVVDYPLIAPRLDYNTFHVQQLSWLHDVTGDARALDAAFRFARYDDPDYTITQSPTHAGDPGFWNHLVYFPQWATPAPGWLQADLGRSQTVDGVHLWTPEPDDLPEGVVWRPASVDVDLSMDGVAWTTFTRPWPDACNDALVEIPPTEARHVRIWLHSPNREEQPHVGLRAFGLRRSSGHPAGVANWLQHGIASRPSTAFTDEGFIFTRISRQTYDLADAFPGGFEILLEGWRGPTDPFPMVPLPTVTVASTLNGPWVPLDVDPRMIGPSLVYQRPGAPDFRYVRLAVDVGVGPLSPAKVFVRPL